MKKTYIIILIVLAVFPGVFASGKTEVKETVNMAVMQGPSGFSASFVSEPVNVQVFASPDEVIPKLVNGELDMAVLPANTCASLYNKGIKIKALAVVGEGMLSVIGQDDVFNTLFVPGIGGTPDHMAKLLYKNYKLDYSINAPAQLAQMLIAGKITSAILPQPFVNLVLSKNSSLTVIHDVQQDWKTLTGNDSYPMSILVATDEFSKKYPSLVKEALALYKESVSKVLENPEEAGKRIEELGIMSASMASLSIKDCALVFITGEDAKNLVSVYYNELSALDSKAIGNKVPDKDFWF